MHVILALSCLKTAAGAVPTCLKRNIFIISTFFWKSINNFHRSLWGRLEETSFLVVLLLPSWDTTFSLAFVAYHIVLSFSESLSVSCLLLHLFCSYSHTQSVCWVFSLHKSLRIKYHRQSNVMPLENAIQMQRKATKTLNTITTTTQSQQQQQQQKMVGQQLNI